MDNFTPEFALVAVAFWIFIALVVIVPIVLHHRRRVETEKTIRMAIEKGASLDPAMLDRLRGASAADQEQDSPENTRRGGIITASVGIGLYLLSVFTGINKLMGPAALVLCIGIGIFVSAKFMKKV